MITLAQVIERFEPDYRARYGHTLGPERAQALRAMHVLPQPHGPATARGLPRVRRSNG
jgi:hypothetical protein